MLCRENVGPGAVRLGLRKRLPASLAIYPVEFLALELAPFGGEKGEASMLPLDASAGVP